MFRGDEDDVVGSLSGDLDAGHVKRLGIDVAIHRKGEDLAEMGGVDVGGSQRGLMQRGAGAGVVVLRSEHLSGGVRVRQQDKYRNESERSCG
jgi:hypothetical protein